jgi:hypothetical protein
MGSLPNTLRGNPGPQQSKTRCKKQNQPGLAASWLRVSLIVTHWESGLPNSRPCSGPVLPTCMSTASRSPTWVVPSSTSRHLIASLLQAVLEHLVKFIMVTRPSWPKPTTTTAFCPTASEHGRCSKPSQLDVFCMDSSPAVLRWSSGYLIGQGPTAARGSTWCRTRIC